MPVLDTIGAASARGFGFGGASAVTGYKFLTQTNSANLILNVGSSTTSLTTTLTSSVQTGNTPSNFSSRPYGVAAAGENIATVAGYSKNNGVTWYSWAPWPYLYANTAPTPDTVVAISTNSKVAVSIYGEYIKTPRIVVTRFRPSTNSYDYQFTSGIVPPLSSIYWPKHSMFVCNSLDGFGVALDDNGVYTGLVNPSGLNWGATPPVIDPISGDLYCWGKPSSYTNYVYLISNANFSSPTFIGTDSVASPYISRPVYVAATNRWYKLIVGPGYAILYQSPSNTPIGFTYYSAVPVPTFSPVSKPALTYDATTGRMYAGYCGVYSDKFGTNYYPVLYYSTDFTNWTFYNYLTGITRNSLL